MNAAGEAHARAAAAIQPSRRRHSQEPTPPRQGPSATTRALAVLLMLGAVLGIYVGGRMLISGLASLQADIFLADWHARGELPSDRAAEVALDAARRASVWYPVAHAELSQREGRVLAWRTYARPAGDPAIEPDRREQLAAFRATVASRPAWPDGWVGLARAKRELLEFDAEFLEALHNALTYGQWRWEINRDVARIGLLAWDHLPMPAQGHILEAASRTAAYSRPEANQLAPYLEHASITKAFCIYQRALQRNSNGLCPTNQKPAPPP